MKRFLTSVSLQHEPKASDVITLVKKTFFARESYEILYHEVWKCGFPHAKRKTAFSHTEWNKRTLLMGNWSGKGQVRHEWDLKYMRNGLGILRIHAFLQDFTKRTQG